ncbi:N-acetylmuramoyl-L-alanine amidase [bacterium]|nr:N-acetylmuramoyl-L-alanine amidase [bacterium]
MKKIIFIVLVVILFGNPTYALDVVYPTSAYTKINSPSTFFVGAVNVGDGLSINGEQIPVHRTGAFAQTVKLNPGRNEFVLTSDGKTKTYVIERPLLGGNYKQAIYNKYNLPMTLEVSKSGAPLRATSVQEGINRISHFQKGMQLKAIGELGDMYKVELSPTQQAWIAKSDVKMKAEPYDRAFLFDYRDRETETDYIYEFALSKKTPYSITEGDVMTLKIFNVGANDDNTAVFKITLNQRLMGYSLQYHGDTLVLKIKKEPDLKRAKKFPLRNVKIVVDPGHGGKELGAVGCCRNYEKDFNLSISRYLEEDLRKMGANVYMTRNSDKFVSLNDRVKYTNDKDAQIFVSIHANSLPDSRNPQKYRGSSAYYYYDEARPLTEAILNSVGRSMNLNIEGIRQASFAVVRNTSAVSVLVETAYVINPDDNELLMTDSFRKQYARAVAEGIKDYVWQNKTRVSRHKHKIKFEKIS